MKGYVTSSPTKDAGDYFPSYPNGRDAARRPSCRVSQHSYHSPAGGQISVSDVGEASLDSGDTSAISRLESQLAKTPAGAGSYRRRPFSQKRQLAEPTEPEEGRPDSPALNAQDQRGNRSSELAKTLSKMSSRVLRQ